MIGRFGLAIARPRQAFAVAGDRYNAGRAGTDLLAAIAILVVATELRWLVQAVWLGAVVDVSLGLHALVHVLTGTVTVDLGVLVVAAAIVALAGGHPRELGRAFDLACVAVLPLVLVDLAAGVVLSIAQLAPPDEVRLGVMAVAYAWTAVLVALAIAASRREPPAIPSPWAERAGWIVVALAAAGLAVQVRWLVTNSDLVRPLQAGAPAPALALPRIGPGGRYGERVSPTPGKVTVVDFWATWCGPCLRALPALDRFARAHPEVTVLAVDLDDPAAARALFDREHYSIGLLADDGDTSERYGVTEIPHTALIAADGTLVEVSHGDVMDLDAEIGRMRH